MDEKRGKGARGGHENILSICFRNTALYLSAFPSLCWKEHPMFEGKDESACMRGKSRSHSPTFHQAVAWGREAAAVAPPRCPLSCSANSFHLGRLSLEFFPRLPYVPASFFSIGVPTYLADGCQCLDWRELERWIAHWPPPPQSSSGLSTPGFDLVPSMEPHSQQLLPFSPPSPTLPLSRPDGQTGSLQ